MFRVLVLALLLAPSAFAALDMTQGKLANGLQYYIKNNAEPADKVELRLVVKAGSRNEAEDEKGIAHLIEHMAFRRTRNFGEGEIIRFLNGEGARWGSDSNAWTSWENTVYHFTVSKQNLPRALQLVADWGGGIVFDPVELAHERDIVQDELRMRNDSSRIYAEYADNIYPGREFSNRMPGGEPEVVASLPQARIEAFYRNQYIAPRMSLIVSGDVSGIDVQSLIKKDFSDIPDKSSAKPLSNPQPSQALNLYANYRAYHLSQSLVSWGWLEPNRTNPDEALLQRDYLRTLALMIVQRRLQAKTGDIYTDAGMGDDDSVPRVDLWMLAVNPQPGKASEALHALLFAAEQARRTGFSAAEAEEVKSLFRAGMNNALKQPQTNSMIASTLLDHVLKGAPAYTPQDWLDRALVWEKTATPQQLQAALDALMQSPGQLVQILRAQNDDAVQFGFYVEEDLARIRAQVAAGNFADGAREVKARKLIDQLPEPGRIELTDTAPGGGVWHLANGMQVLWQKAKPGEKQIGIALRIEGAGLLGLPAKDRLVAAMLSPYMARAGLNGLKPEEVADVLQGHTASVAPWVDTDISGVRGMAAPDDIETALQLLYLNLQPPQESSKAQTETVALMRNWLDNGQSGSLNKLLAYGDAWPIRPDWTREQIDMVSLADYQRVHATIFGDPARMRVVLTGITDPQRLQALVARYLASISTSKYGGTLGQVRRMPLTGKHVATTAPRSEANLRWLLASPQKIDTATIWRASALADILQLRLQPALRFEGAKSYSVSAWADAGIGEGIQILASSNGPATQCRWMAQKTLDVMKELAWNGPSDTEVAAALARFAKNEHDRLMNPAGRAQSLVNRWGWDNGFATLEPDFASVVTRPALQSAARQWLHDKATYLVADGCSDEITSVELSQMWRNQIAK